MSYRLFLLLSLTSFNIARAMQLEQKNLFVPQSLGDVKVLYKKDQFFVNSTPVEHMNTDKELRKISKENLVRLLAKGSYVSITEISENQYKLQLNNRLYGGGAFGATLGAFLGKAAVSLAGHGTIYLVGALTGPFAPATIIALESVFAAPIEAASMAGAIAGGMALGVATGPV